MRKVRSWIQNAWDTMLSLSTQAELRKSRCTSSTGPVITNTSVPLNVASRPKNPKIYFAAETKTMSENSHTCGCVCGEGMMRQARVPRQNGGCFTGEPDSPSSNVFVEEASRSAVA